MNTIKALISLTIVLLFLYVFEINSQNPSSIPLSDLDFLYKTLVQKHPKLSAINHRKKFDSAYKDTRKKFDEVSRTKGLMEMMKLVATLNDGHTSIARIWDDKTNFRRLPLRFYWFSDGLFISRIEKKNAKYVGMKVTNIGGVPIKKVIEKAEPFIHGENSMKLKDVLPNRLTIFEFLDGLKLTNGSDSVSIALTDSDNNKHILKLHPPKRGEKIDWITAQNSDKPKPHYLSNQDSNYWSKYLTRDRVYYFQFNAVAETEGEPFKLFIDKMFREIDSLPVEKFVIDIRNNNGGDNTILKPLIHKLIQNKRLNQRGRLFTIIGRLTFSAAVNLVTELEKHTNSIFVGEPTAAGPNHYGETRLARLPDSGVALLYSSQFWQGAMPWDKRKWIEPSMKATISSDDYKNNRDPILERIVNFKYRRAERFGKNIFKGKLFRGSFAPDGKTFYFFKKVTKGTEDYRIFVSRLIGNKWSSPSRVDLGGEYSDTYPSISKDGSRLVFASYRPVPGDKSKKPNAHLWYSKKVDDKWGTPIFMKQASRLGHYHSWVEFGPDGNVYYQRTTPDWKSSINLISKWNGREYSKPIEFKEVEKWKKWNPDVTIVGGSPGPTKNIIFLDVATTNARSGRNASDIWISKKQNGKWTDPRPLNPSINREGFDVFPFFSPDGKYLYFVRDFNSFYRTKLKDAVEQ